MLYPLTFSKLLYGLKKKKKLGGISLCPMSTFFAFPDVRGIFGSNAMRHAMSRASIADEEERELVSGLLFARDNVAGTSQ